MFSLNKDSRNYLLKERITIHNEFVNEGLITHVLNGSDFNVIL
jgi:hypothetical protein